MVIITSIATYSMIVAKIRMSRKHLSRTNSNTDAKLKKEFLVPMILISSYILLYIIPSLNINFYP